MTPRQIDESSASERGLPATRYLTVSQACEMAAISRSTFYRLLEDPESGLAEVAFRVPGIRRIRIPSNRFIRWLEGGGRKAPKKPRGSPC